MKKKYLGFSIAAVFTLFTVGQINVKAQPATETFQDDVFYQCVIKAYNQKAGTELKETEKLTDEQLATITNLNCTGTKEKKIKDISGLEKLTGLTYLDLSENEIKSINVSKQTQLEALYLTNNLLTTIDVSRNGKLKALNLDKNQLLSLNLEGLTIEPSQFSAASQEREVEVEKEGNQYALLLKDYDRNLKPSRVLTSDKIDYNRATGLILFEKLPKEISYEYDLDQYKNIQVTLKLTEKKEEIKEEPLQPEIITDVPDTKTSQSVSKILIASFLVLISAGVFYICLGRKQKDVM